MMPPSSSAVTGDNFMFRSTCPSPCTPQSPQSAGNYFFSAPSSPTNSSPFYRQISFAVDAITNSQESDHTHQQSDDNIEDTPVDSANLDHSLAKKYFSFNFHATEDDDDDETTKEEDFAFDFNAITQDDGTTKEDFTFDFGGQLEKSTPLVNQNFQGGLTNSTEPPLKKTLQNAVSFRQRKKYSDICAKSTERVHNSSNYMNGRKKSPKTLNMISEPVDTKISCKALSSTPRSEASEQVISMERSSSSSTSWLVKWKLPDLLFRSASEGHETKKKYEIERKNAKNIGDGSVDSGSNGGSRKKKERVSGHELHYKVNRATAAEMRRKTFLPYKQNLMGCMDLDSLILEPSVRGINSSQVRRQ